MTELWRSQSTLTQACTIHRGNGNKLWWPVKQACL